MKRILFCLGILFVLGSSCTQDRNIEEEQVINIDPSSELMFYWNFNALVGISTAIAPDLQTSSATATISYDGTGAGFMDGDTGGYTINARNDDPAESLLKVRNPSDTRNLIFNVPTTGYRKIILQFATARSPNNGATTQNYSYSIDGINFIQTGLSKINHNTTAEIPDLILLDFSTITEVDNNPNFKVKVSFEGATISSTSGNNRFDNVTLEGVPLL